jgi:hypothetical protein
VRFQSGRFEVEITGLSGELAFQFGAGAEALFEAAEAAAGAVRAHLERLLAVGAGASPALLEAEAVQTVHWGLQRERRADFPVFALGERMFAPAGRGALALLDFSPAAGDGAGLDPAVLEFARQYLGMRRAAAVMQPAPREDDAVDRLLGGRLVLRDNRLRVVHPDHREVDLARASSGQQELAPLIVSLGLDREFPIREWGHVTVEEPESHIHPPAQQALVRLLVERFAGSASVTRGLLLTTHSPYVVTTLNNLAEAGAVEKALWEAVGQPAARARLDHPTFELVAGARGRADLGRHYLGLDAVVPPEQRIPVGDFAAVHFEGGDARDIIDPETGLAVAQTIDDVSQSIMEHFSALSELGAAVLDAARDTDGNR